MKIAHFKISRAEQIRNMALKTSIIANDVTIIYRLIIVLDDLVERGSNKMCTARASWHGPKNPFKQL